VALAALELGLPLLRPASPGDPEFLDALREKDLDAVAVVAYGALLPSTALDVSRHGWINLHFSLLPAWRGAAPVQRAVWHGDQITGATTFQIVRELDRGPVFGQMTYAVPPRATAGDVLEALATHGAKLLVSTMDAIGSDAALPAPQGTDGASYAAKISTEDARVDWAAPAFAVDRQVRACTPTPGAWTVFRGRRLKLGPVMPACDVPPEALAELAAGAAELGRGELAASKRAVWVGTGSEPVLLGQVAPEGKPRLDAAAWARGARIEPGEVLEL
jgi:methionyl-tRNA formyltransferase